MSIKLYYFPISQPSRSVLMLCREGGVEVEEVVVDVMKGEHKAPEYLAVNPMGLVPAIVDGDFTLAEGAAILAYIAESRGLTTWFPSDPKVRARVNYWLHWNHTGTRLSTSKILLPTLFKKGVDDSDRAAFDNSLTYLNTHLAANEFLAGTSSPTIADLFIVPELDQQMPCCFGLVDMSRFPNIARYLESVKAAVPSYSVIHAPVESVASAGRSAPTEEPPKPAPIAICGQCGKGDNVIPVIRGRPGSELIAKAKAGLVKLGGCTEGPAKGWCKDCDEFILE